jgi:hypothetical protein
MARVIVRNLNEHPFAQKFNGVQISLGKAGEPNDSVEMDEEDAVLFLGTFHPMKLDNKGNHDPRFFKKLRVERDPSEVKKDLVNNKPICPVCREQTSSWTELEAHQRLMHADQLVKDPEYDLYLAQKAKGNAAKAAVGAGVPKAG